MKGHLAGTILDTLRARGDACTYNFVRPDGEVEAVPAGALADRISGFAVALRESAGLAPRTAIPIITSDPARIWVAFAGAMAADLIPFVMAAPSFKTHLPTYVRNLSALLSRYGTQALLIDRENRERLAAVLAEIGGLRAVELEPLERTSTASPPLDGDGARTAFLQHSSGSTGIPKGVALSHAAVHQHLTAYARELALAPGDRIASWLPLYHDMGLATSFLLPLVTGTGCDTMRPDRWIMDPASILRLVTERRSTLTWWPNFAFALLASRTADEDLATLDLSSLRMVINCSEPVMASSHDAFAARFERAGLRRSALHTCYAMAENVFAVTQSPGGGPGRATFRRESLAHGESAVPCAADDPASKWVLASGRPIEGVRVAIVDDDRAECPPGRVGEIAIAGASLFTEYHNAPDLTAPVRRGEWYYTGDIGFFANGELAVLGRKSDLIIVGGRKFYPTEIEALVAEVEGIKEGRVVAFGVTSEERGTQELVVLAESEQHDDAAQASRMKRELKLRVQSRMDVTVDHTRIVAPRTLAKTSSGKMARNDNRAWFLRTADR